MYNKKVNNNPPKKPTQPIGILPKKAVKKAPKKVQKSVENVTPLPRREYFGRVPDNVRMLFELISNKDYDSYEGDDGQSDIDSSVTQEEESGDVYDLLHHLRYHNLDIKDYIKDSMLYQVLYEDRNMVKEFSHSRDKSYKKVFRIGSFEVLLNMALFYKREFDDLFIAAKYLIGYIDDDYEECYGVTGKKETERPVISRKCGGYSIDYGNEKIYIPKEQRRFYIYHILFAGHYNDEILEGVRNKLADYRNKIGSCFDYSHLCHHAWCVNPKHGVFESHKDNVNRYCKSGANIYLKSPEGYLIGSVITCPHNPKCITSSVLQIQPIENNNGEVVAMIDDKNNVIRDGIVVNVKDRLVNKNVSNRINNNNGNILVNNEINNNNNNNVKVNNNITVNTNDINNNNVNNNIMLDENINGNIIFNNNINVINNGTNLNDNRDIVINNNFILNININNGRKRKNNKK